MATVRTGGSRHPDHCERQQCQQFEPAKQAQRFLLLAPMYDEAIWAARQAKHVTSDRRRCIARRCPKTTPERWLRLTMCIARRGLRPSIAIAQLQF